MVFQNGVSFTVHFEENSQKIMHDKSEDEEIAVIVIYCQGTS